MLKKRVLYLMFFAILPIVFASPEEQIYTGTVQSGQVIEAEDYIFQIRIVGTLGASVNYSSKSFLVKAEECEWDGNVKFCIGTPTFVGRNRETWEDIYQVNVDIVERKGFDINKSVMDTKLLIGEKASVKVVIRNDGAFTVENVDFNDVYPPELKVTDAEGCFLSGNAVEWHGIVGTNSKQVCTYTLTATGGIEYISRANASYYDGKEKQKAYSNKIKIRVQDYSLKVTPSVNITRQGIGGLIELGLMLGNINLDDIIVRSFEINIPPGLSIVNSNGLEKKGQLLLWKGILERDGNKSFAFSLHAERSGNFTIAITKKFVEGEIGRDRVEFLNFSVNCDCLLIQHKLSRRDDDTAHLRVYISNPSYETPFNDITIDLSTNIQHADEIKKNYLLLKPRETILLFNSEVEIPDENAYYNISIGYESDYRQRFKESKQIIIEQAEPETAVIDITTGEELIKEAELVLPQNESEEIMNTAVEQFNKKWIVMVIVFLFVIGLVIVHLKKGQSARQ